MASKELIESWKRTTAFLLDARSHLSESTEGICQDEIAEFQRYLGHNELELALDMLDVIFEKSQMETSHVMELMALAAANMGLHDRVRRYDEHLSTTRGISYKTRL